MPLKKRSVKIMGHLTSVSLEEEFWDALKNIADQKNISLNTLIANIDTQRTESKSAGNLSSALRVFVLKWLSD